MNCELFELLKIKYRRIIKDKRIDVVKTRDFQLALCRHLKNPMKEAKVADAKLYSIYLKLINQRRKPTTSEINYLVSFFCDWFSDSKVSDKKLNSVR